MPEDELVEGLVGKCNEYLSEDNFAEALACFDGIIASNPEAGKPHYLKGLCLYKLGKFDEAIASFDEAIARGGKEPAPWQAKGMALFQLSKYDEAITCFEKALELDAKFVDAAFMKGACAMLLDRPLEVKEAIGQAASIDPKRTLDLLDAFFEGVIAPSKEFPLEEKQDLRAVLDALRSEAEKIIKLKGEKP